MPNIDETDVEQFAQGLAKQSGDKYQVELSSRSGEIRNLHLPVNVTSGSAANVLAYDAGNNQLTLIGFSGSSAGYDLPLATAPVVRQMKQTYREWKPKIVLVTSASVPTHLQRQLEDEDVEVVPYKNAEQAVLEVAKLLREQQQTKK